MPHSISPESSLDSLNTFNPNIVRKEPMVFPVGTKRAKKVDLFASLPPEPEDAHLTGATRSLYRRLLALNLHMRLAPVVVDAVHANAKIA
jgi:hypothetical protein